MRRAVPACCLLLTAYLSGACTPAGTDRPISDAATEDTVTVLYIGDERLWHPSMSVSAQHLLFLRLFSWDENGQPEGELVREWETSADGRTWTYHLRTDVRWHDGVPFTARDIEFTHDLLSDPKNGFPWDIGGRTVTVIDDSTLTIRYDRPGWPEPMENFFVYYPKHLLQDLDPERNYRWDFWATPIGNGPYRYVRHVPKTMVELERNPDYYGPPPAIERVILRFGSPNGRIELQAGNADVAAIMSLNLRDALRLAADDERFRVYYLRDTRSYVLHWNLTNPLFVDRRVRRGLTYALDRDVFARVLDLPQDLSFIDVPVPPTSIGTRQPSGTPLPTPFDRHVADSLLRAAGWVDDDGDGIRERAGERLAFSVLVDAETSRLAVLLQSQLRAVGAEVKIQTLASALMRDRLQDGDFETTIRVSRYKYLLQDIVSANTDTEAWRTTFAGLNRAELVEVAAALDTAFAPESRRQLHDRFWALWQEEVPATYLANRGLATVAHRRIRGLSSPHRVFATTHMRELWVEEEK